MNIAICSIYGESYSKDKMFDANACNIGQNLLMPNIMLKKELEKDGKVLPKGLLPMSEVVKYLNIDIDYYKKIAEYQLKEQVVKTVL